MKDPTLQFQVLLLKACFKRTWWLNRLASLCKRPLKTFSFVSRMCQAFFFFSPWSLVSNVKAFNIGHYSSTKYTIFANAKIWMIGHDHHVHFLTDLVVFVENQAVTRGKKTSRYMINIPLTPQTFKDSESPTPPLTPPTRGLNLFRG